MKWLRNCLRVHRLNTLTGTHDGYRNGTQSTFRSSVQQWQHGRGEQVWYDCTSEFQRWKKLLSILGLVDTQTTSTVDASNSGEAADTTAALLPGLADGASTSTAEAAAQPTLVGLDPAALLAQLQLTPAQPSIPQLEPGAAATGGGAKLQHSRGGDARSELSFGVESASSMQAKVAVKSGKAALDAAASAANTAAADAGEPKPGAGIQGARGQVCSAGVCG